METNSPDRVLTPLEFIRERVGECDVETALDSLALDSLELLDLQLECEKYFRRQLPNESYQQMHTVGDLANAFC